MIRTITDARTKMCPLAPMPAKCVASDCMAWEPMGGEGESARGYCAVFLASIRDRPAPGRKQKPKDNIRTLRIVTPLKPTDRGAA